MSDTYWPRPLAPFDERRSQFLEFSASAESQGDRGFFNQISRLELGREIDEDAIRHGLKYVDTNRDCTDFAVGGLLRIIAKYRDSPLLSRDLVNEIEARLLAFKYWWDEPGYDRRCYHTENHQIIFHTEELIAGQLYRDRVFENSGRDGRYHIEHATVLIERWLDFRIRFGFSEWLSNCYFDEDLLALVNLFDFAENPELRRRASLLIDTILFEQALHSHGGVFGCTHGRTYPRLIKGGRGESSASVSKLMLGVGIYNNPANFGAVCLATSDYSYKPLLEQIATEVDGPQRIRERHSINIDDAPSYDLSYEDELDGHLYWSIQDYIHPKVIDLSRRLSEKYGVRLHEDYQERYDQCYRWQIEEHGSIIDPSMDCHAMTEVNVETYRTPDYTLSCAQDYRPGKPGYQQHIWQATLGIDAVIFSNHPGSEDESSRPNFWAGNGIMPRAAQSRNTLVCIHHIPQDDDHPYSHTYFPQDAFDEILDDPHWVFARVGNAYVALFTQHPHSWLQNDLQQVEIRVDEPDCVWLCEMGSGDGRGGFAEFVSGIRGADIVCDGLNVRYDSPSQGLITFGWDRPLIVSGDEVALRGYKRFDNPFCQSEFGDRSLTIQNGTTDITLDFGND